MRDSLKLHPDLQVYLAFGLYECYKKGLHIRITETNRTIGEQNNYYNQGYSQVRGNDFGSMHQWGVAFDVCRNDGAGAYDFTNWIDKVAKIYKSYPLAWGGDWEGFVDQPHFQMKAYEDSYGGTGKLKRSYANPDVFRKKWKKSLITQQFADLNISRTKSLLEKKFTQTNRNSCSVWKGVKTISKTDTLSKGTPVYMIKDLGDGRSHIAYIKKGKIKTGYIYNYTLVKKLSLFSKLTLTANKKIYSNKYNSVTKKVTKGSNTNIVLPKGTKVRFIVKRGNWMKVRYRWEGKHKVGWIAK